MAPPPLPAIFSEGDVRVIVPGRLLWCCVPERALVEHGGVPAEVPGVRLVSTDDVLIYEAFFADFGPLNLGHVVKFCRMMEDILRCAASERSLVVHWCTDHRHKRANASFLCCCFAIVVLRASAHSAYAPFFGIDPPLQPFRDAGFGVCTFQLLLIDVARGVAKAVALGHLKYAEFDCDEYENFERLEHGDLAWIVPRKFVAFSSPLAQRREIAPGLFTFTVEDYVPLFQRLGVTLVVRFNKKLYDKRKFTAAGIRHVELFYEDGSNPTEAIMQRFLQLCERESGAIAVHCKAGLGRTGTNIGAYMMKHWGYSAAEAIAWMRISRPGSVIGPQQQFMLEAEARLWREGDAFRRQHPHWHEQPLAPAVRPTSPARKPPTDDDDGAAPTDDDDDDQQTAKALLLRRRQQQQSNSAPNSQQRDNKTQRNTDRSTSSRLS